MNNIKYLRFFYILLMLVLFIIQEIFSIDNKRTNIYISQFNAYGITARNKKKFLDNLALKLSTDSSSIVNDISYSKIIISGTINFSSPKYLIDIEIKDREVNKVINRIQLEYADDFNELFNSEAWNNLIEKILKSIPRPATELTPEKTSIQDTNLILPPIKYLPISKTDTIKLPAETIKEIFEKPIKITVFDSSKLILIDSLRKKNYKDSLYSSNIITIYKDSLINIENDILYYKSINNRFIFIVIILIIIIIILVIVIIRKIKITEINTTEIIYSEFWNKLEIIAKNFNFELIVNTPLSEATRENKLYNINVEATIFSYLSLFRILEKNYLEKSAKPLTTIYFSEELVHNDSYIALLIIWDSKKDGNIGLPKKHEVKRVKDFLSFNKKVEFLVDEKLKHVGFRLPTVKLFFY